MTELLTVIKDSMDTLGLAYSYGEYNGNSSTYWVGEKQELPNSKEDARKQAVIYLDGYADTYTALEQDLERIKKYFTKLYVNIGESFYYIDFAGCTDATVNGNSKHYLISLDVLAFHE